MLGLGLYCRKLQNFLTPEVADPNSLASEASSVHNTTDRAAKAK